MQSLTEKSSLRGILERAADWYAEARSRAKRRRSAWNLILIPLVLIGWLASWYGLFLLIWMFHVALYPEHELQDFWRESTGFSSFMQSFLMVFAVMPGTLALGLALANCSAWLIAPARRALDIESAGYPSTSFREATTKLFKFAAWALSLGLVTALLAASALVSLK